MVALSESGGEGHTTSNISEVLEKSHPSSNPLKRSRYQANQELERYDLLPSRAEGLNL